MMRGVIGSIIDMWREAMRDARDIRAAGRLDAFKTAEMRRYHSDWLNRVVSDVGPGPHISHCSRYNGPAYPRAPCDCGKITRRDCTTQRMFKRNRRARDKYDRLVAACG